MNFKRVKMYMREKWQVYHEAEIDEIWFIDDEEREIVIDRRKGKEYTTATINSGKVVSETLPGFFVQAEWLGEEIMLDPILCLQRFWVNNGK